MQVNFTEPYVPQSAPTKQKSKDKKNKRSKSSEANAHNETATNSNRPISFISSSTATTMPVDSLGVAVDSAVGKSPKKPRPYFYPSQQRVDINSHDQKDFSNHSSNVSLFPMDLTSAKSMPVVSYHKPHNYGRAHSAHNTTSGSSGPETRAKSAAADHRQHRSRQDDVTYRSRAQSKSSINGKHRPYAYPNHGFRGDDVTAVSQDKLDYHSKKSLSKR